jgi:phenylpyruvate tautomerase PptA (4-oxalocrotonate tautomerase family)
MPMIVVDGPEIQEIEGKRELAKKLTDAAVEAYGIPLRMSESVGS